MFLRPSVILFTGRCLSDIPWEDTTLGRHHPPQAGTIPPQETATAADDTHPTGMHYCAFSCVWLSRRIRCDHSVVDLGGVRDTHTPGGPNSFNFMQFLGKFGKIVCWRPLEGWCPTSGKSWIRHCHYS